eukprot:tig00000042_g15422.t1
MAVPDDAPAAASSSKGASADGGFELPWLEKYRPQVVDDIVGNEEAVARLRVIASEGNIPNLIISGPPGTGKTTSILCLAHALLGAAFKDAVLELNASDDRGIDVVRNKIKMFAQKKVTLKQGQHKIIILDEADSMTEGAQQALRRTMELYSATTRFALACNQSSKIIEPIQSRCAIVRFTRLSDEQLYARLEEVARLENVSFTSEGLQAIVFTADGDMRQALNNLQGTHAGFGHVDAESVFKVCDIPQPKIVHEMVDACIRADIKTALERLHELWSKGYAAVDIVGTLFKVVKGFNMDESLALEFTKEIGMTHMRVAEGVATQLQLAGLLATLCAVSRNKK